MNKNWLGLSWWRRRKVIIVSIQQIKCSHSNKIISKWIIIKYLLKTLWVCRDKDLQVKPNSHNNFKENNCLVQTIISTCQIAFRQAKILSLLLVQQTYSHLIFHHSFSNSHPQITLVDLALKKVLQRWLGVKKKELRT